MGIMSLEFTFCMSTGWGALARMGGALCSSGWHGTELGWKFLVTPGNVEGCWVPSSASCLRTNGKVLEMTHSQPGSPAGDLALLSCIQVSVALQLFTHHIWAGSEERWMCAVFSTYREPHSQSPTCATVSDAGKSVMPGVLSHKHTKVYPCSFIVKYSLVHTFLQNSFPRKLLFLEAPQLISVLAPSSFTFQIPLAGLSEDQGTEGSVLSQAASLLRSLLHNQGPVDKRPPMKGGTHSPTAPSKPQQ